MDNESRKSIERPALITIICSISFVAIPILILLIMFSPKLIEHLVNYYGKLFPYFTVITNLVMFVAFVGIWRMKHWGVFLFGITYVIDTLHIHFAGAEFWWNYIPGTIIIIICLIYFRKMD